MRTTIALLIVLARTAVAAPQVLAVEDEDPVAVASDDQMVYWALRNSVRGLPVAGGEPVTLAELPDISALVATPAGLVAAEDQRGRAEARATCTVRCRSCGGTGLNSRAEIPRRRQRA